MSIYRSIYIYTPTIHASAILLIFKFLFGRAAFAMLITLCKTAVAHSLQVIYHSRACTKRTRTILSVAFAPISPDLCLITTQVGRIKLGIVASIILHVDTYLVSLLRNKNCLSPIQHTLCLLPTCETYTYRMTNNYSCQQVSNTPPEPAKATGNTYIYRGCICIHVCISVYMYIQTLCSHIS